MDNLAKLKVAVEAKALRNDFPDQFITFTEWVEEDIRERYNRISPLHVVADISLDADTIALPADLNEIETLVIPQLHPLRRVSVEELYLTDSTDSPLYYTQSNTNILLPSAPTSPIAAKLSYWKKLTPLGTADADTNEVLQNASSVYFHGILYHFFDWVRKDEESQIQWNKYAGALEAMITGDRNKRQSGVLSPRVESYS